MRERVGRWRRAGERIAFVPTMGNLHAGHASLVELARRHGDRFVASIFVNPMQFGPNEDFAHYPRTPRDDERLLEEAGCDLMFTPGVDEIFPGGSAAGTRVSVPRLSGILCGAVRPGHFEGVTSVVARLFGIVQPDVAVFGEKDWQQLTIIRRMVADLWLPVTIVGAPTVRDPDGLALSSRNQYLTDEERRIAPRLHAALRAAAARLKSGEREHEALARAAQTGLAADGFVPEYFAIRDPDTLAPASVGATELVLLAAARLGRARLIDNIRLNLPA